MQRKATHIGWIQTLMALTLRTLALMTLALMTLVLATSAMAQEAQAPQEAPPAKDPWGILDGTYYPPGTKALSLKNLPVDGESAGFIEDGLIADGAQNPERPLRLAGQWAKLSRTYRTSLEHLGQPDRKELLKTVADLEVAAIGNNPERRMPRLARVEMDAIRELAQKDAEALVPVFQLHHDLYMEHRENRQWYLLHHTISMVKDVAALYVKKAGSQGAKVNAARMLASLAGHLQAAQQPASVALFEQVIELDPRNESAYLGLAAHYEKHFGPFESVVKYLELLLEVYPEHREGRLRLAINKLRLKKEKAAAKLLRGLLDEPESDWVFRLAAQELARYEMDQGRVSAAIQILEKAVRQAPGDQKLCIQLSFLYERNRRSNDAQRIAKLARSGSPAAEAPRGRYNSWPKQALEQDRIELRQLAANRTALLARLFAQGPKTSEPEANP